MSLLGRASGRAQSGGAAAAWGLAARGVSDAADWGFECRSLTVTARKGFAVGRGLASVRLTEPAGGESDAAARGFGVGLEVWVPLLAVAVRMGLAVVRCYAVLLAELARGASDAAVFGLAVVRQAELVRGASDSVVPGFAYRSLTVTARKVFAVVRVFAVGLKVWVPLLTVAVRMELLAGVR